VRRAHLFDESVARISTVKFINDLIHVVPGPIHPKVKDPELVVLKKLDQAAGVVIVGVCEHDVRYVGVGFEVASDMLDDLVAVSVNPPSMTLM
jgi:hypothetical protein